MDLVRSISCSSSKKEVAALREADFNELDYERSSIPTDKRSSLHVSEAVDLVRSLSCTSRRKEIALAERQASFNVGIFIEDDNKSTSSDDSSSQMLDDDDIIFPSGESLLASKPYPMKRLVSASSKHLGTAHSSMDVHSCLDSTCVYCKPLNVPLFLPGYSADIDTLKRTMWGVYHEEKREAQEKRRRTKKKKNDINFYEI